MNEEFKRMQQLAGIDEIKVMYNMATTNVDWYYVDEYSNYPDPAMRGGVVPDVEEYDYPSQYEGTELYIPKGTKGYIEDDKFIDDEGNDVPFTPEYFDR